MIRTKALVAGLAALAIAAGPAAAEPAGAPPPSPPPIDWRDFIDTDMDGDHVVGEELCAAPGETESIPDLFVVI